MLRIRKAGGAELSSGAMDNPAFTDSRPDEEGVQAEAGDVALLEVYCDEGESFTAVVVPGVSELRYRVDGDWLEPGADAHVGAVTSDTPVPLSVRVHLAADPSPALPRPVGAAVEAPTASGSVGIVVTLAGHSYAVPTSSGMETVPIGVHAHAVAEEIVPQVHGSVASALTLFGHAVAEARPVTKTLSLLPTISTSPLYAHTLVDGPSSGTGGLTVWYWLGDDEEMLPWSVEYSIVVLNAAGTTELRQVKEPTVVKSASTAFGPATVKMEDQAIPTGGVTASERFAVKVTAVVGGDPDSRYFALATGEDPPAQTAAWVELSVLAETEYDLNEDLEKYGWWAKAVVDFGASRGKMHFSEGW
jgi:hypothetical protein